MPRECCAWGSTYGPCNTGWATSRWRRRCVIWPQQPTFMTKWTWLRFRLSARPERCRERPSRATRVSLGRPTREDRLPGAKGRYLRSRYSLAEDQGDLKREQRLGVGALA